MKNTDGFGRQNWFYSTLMLVTMLVEVLWTLSKFISGFLVYRKLLRARENLFQKGKPRIWDQTTPLSKKACLVLMSESGAWQWEILGQRIMLQRSRSPNVAPSPRESASLRNLVEIQILGAYPRSNK